MLSQDFIAKIIRLNEFNIKLMELNLDAVLFWQIVEQKYKWFDIIDDLLKGNIRCNYYNYIALARGDYKDD